MDYPKTRSEAIKTGAKYYFTGTPCTRGHVAMRKAKGSCVDCMKEDWVKDNAKRIGQPKSAASKAAGQRYYTRNKDAVIARANMRPPAEKRRYQKQWEVTHAAEMLAKNSVRKRRHRKATPPWITKAQKAEMRALYLAAQRITRDTGVRYVVDHNLPLQSDEICGLHVPWNLSIMTQEENLRKSNKILDQYA